PGKPTGASKFPPEEVREDWVPKEDYTSVEFAELERKYLWPRIWQVACREEDLPKTGSFVTYEILDESVIVTRTAEGEIKAYNNACLHRGRRLLSRSLRGRSDGPRRPSSGGRNPVRSAAGLHHRRAFRPASRRRDALCGAPHGGGGFRQRPDGTADGACLAARPAHEPRRTRGVRSPVPRHRRSLRGGRTVRRPPIGTRLRSTRRRLRVSRRYVEPVAPKERTAGKRSRVRPFAMSLTDPR
ncbi:hypothetical protein EON77_19310, partial [bacterium]